MSYVQGTKVRVIGEFKDPVTDAFEDPDDVVVTIYPPEGLATIIRRFDDADGTITQISTGVYETVIDTAPAAGEWRYVFEGTGAEAVAKLQRLRVRPRPAIIP